MPSRSSLGWWLVLAAGVTTLTLAMVVRSRGRARATVAASATGDAARPSWDAPMVRGRPEGCLVCHAGVAGLDSSHAPARIGCAACHGGDVSARTADAAHAGMVLVPGNLADAASTCAQAGCHASVLPRIQRSIMTTMSGVVEVNRRAFGEPPGELPPHVGSLGQGAADSHVRQLCASCHLGQQKIEWGPIGEDARGGGCNSCHLAYDAEALRQLEAYQTTVPAMRTNIPLRHPSFTVAVGNGYCFGCHSRSGRISTSYEGWHELRDAPSTAALAADAATPRPRFRELADGRVFTRVTPDAHQTRGLDCIDCHTAGEVMGAGKVVTHAREQVQIRCEDCHARRLPSVSPAHADAETQTLLTLRNWHFRPGERLGVAASGAVLSNVVLSADSTARLRRKRTGAWSPLRPPTPSCTRGRGHARLSCTTCHTAWAPRCATCHTAFDPAAEAFDHVDQKGVTGAWRETSGPFEAAPPTLGIRWDSTDAEYPRGVVDTFVPGMIMTLDRNRTAGGAPDTIFRRMYARIAAHTTTRTARTCASCHADPVALGYGRGRLRFVVTGRTGRWTFSPEHAALSDGLPGDAWTGFLAARQGMVSTRDDVRPFTVEEQRRILAVGACLTCHAENSRVMQRALDDFAATQARKSVRCAEPRFD